MFYKIVEFCLVPFHLERKKNGGRGKIKCKRIRRVVSNIHSSIHLPFLNSSTTITTTTLLFIQNVSKKIHVHKEENGSLNLGFGVFFLKKRMQS
jgi:hypothetical protein